MMRHYVIERDEELWHVSNQTYARILTSLPSEIATRYGCLPDNRAEELEAKLALATKTQDRTLVADLAKQFANRGS
jgi:hypothetical protein